ncbi:hypothetical protein D0Z07_8738 [Hyphodiscus hymeniophilus]|uniref:Uncharacterized protein n=1 Tax=Hyphodiscus hymeniophilus TaxID=353542 RepID=A0A9P6SK82_9HELO|nr:hypothetical protein D0Z07_8738 [Hyphodiscus hymeniophilus]
MTGSTTATFAPEARLRGDPSDDGVHVGDKASFVHLTPRTHDISLTGAHVPSIDQVAADINYAVQAVWPKRHEIRYSKAQVLLLSWEDDDLGVKEEIIDLRHVFENFYRFDVEEHKIPSEKPDKNVKRKVLEFLNKDGDDTLLVVYYAGHARSGEQSNEGSIWFAHRADPSVAVPSGGIQSLFEEADADALLLYDCCHSASVPTCKLQLGKGGVTEVIAACGYETFAPEVDEHSFTKALTETLAKASTELPFSVGELHSRILSHLKCWAPKLARDTKRNYIENADGRLLYERQPRKSPIYSILSETKPRRSIVLGRLPLHDRGSLGVGSGSSTSVPEAFEPSTSSTSSSKYSFKKRKLARKDGQKCAQVLISVRVDQTQMDQRKWIDWIREMPSDGKDVHVEGRWDSFSSLILLRMPVAVWNLLPDSPGYDFIGFVTSANLVNSYDPWTFGDITSYMSLETGNRNSFRNPQSDVITDTGADHTKSIERSFLPQQSGGSKTSMHGPCVTGDVEEIEEGLARESPTQYQDRTWEKESVNGDIKLSAHSQPSAVGSSSSESSTSVSLVYNILKSLRGRQSNLSLSSFPPSLSGPSVATAKETEPTKPRVAYSLAGMMPSLKDDLKVEAGPLNLPDGEISSLSPGSAQKSDSEVAGSSATASSSLQLIESKSNSLAGGFESNKASGIQSINLPQAVGPSSPISRQMEMFTGYGHVMRVGSKAGCPRLTSIAAQNVTIFGANSVLWSRVPGPIKLPKGNCGQVDPLPTINASEVLQSTPVTR